MCDHLLREPKLAIRSELKHLAVCCQAPTITQELLWVAGFTLIALGWTSLILLSILAYSEGRTERIRARRHSKMANDEEGFFASMAGDFNGGLPLTDRAVRSMYEVRNCYENLPNMYAEAVAVRIAVKEASYGEDSAMNDVEQLWRTILEEVPRDGVNTTDYLNPAYIQDEEEDDTYSPWGSHWDTIMKRLKRLSEIKRDRRGGVGLGGGGGGGMGEGGGGERGVDEDGEDNGGFAADEDGSGSLSCVRPSVSPAASSSSTAPDSAVSSIPRSNSSPANLFRKTSKPERRHSFRSSFKRRKKNRQLSIKSNFSGSSNSLGEQTYESLVSQKGILRVLAVPDQGTGRYKGRRRHGVSFLEDTNRRTSTDGIFSYEDIGTV